jgi:hypothetical protein
MTGNWALLFGVVALLAGLAFEMPTRTGYLAWAESARDRLSSGT